MAKRGRPSNQEIAQRKMDAGQENRQAGVYNGTKADYLRSGVYRIMRLAWESVRTGTPFDQKLLDSLPIYNQENYENTRLSAMNVKVAGIPMPAWNSETAFPPKVGAALAQGWRIAKVQAWKETEPFYCPRGKANWMAPVAEWEQSSESQPTIY